MEWAERGLSDRFALDDRVGSGSFGEVFRATDRETGDVVAVKRLHRQTSDPTAVQRFHLEAKLLARVQSPHVVRYVAHGTDDEGRLCLALEWLKGCDLARRQRAAPLTLAQVLDVVSQAGEGLAALHAHGIVHRDVKPSNFFLEDGDDRELHVKLIDLGIARSLDDAAITLEGFRVGSPGYMSPEQARGDDAITALTDVYSLGVVLFELIAGRRPFVGRDPFAVIAQIVLQQPPQLRDLVPSVPPALARIVERAMARDPERRYQDAREMAEAIRALAIDDASTREIQQDSATLALSPQQAVAAAELRVVTALFVGLKGAATESNADPFERFEQIVVANGGTAHRTLGRRAVAVFGMERSTGDEALRAARTALESSKRLPGVRVALATCRVPSNTDGLPAEAIERGAMQLERAIDSIPVDTATARMVDAHFRLETVDGDAVLRGERESVDGSGPKLFGRATPFVGRDREMITLDAFFDECVDDSVARGVLVTGTAGIGKSRIRYEWLERLRTRGRAIALLTSRGDPTTARSSFGLLARALRSRARIVDGEPIERQRIQIRNVLLRAVSASDRERVGAFLGEMIGVRFDDADDDALRAARADPVLRGDAMRAAFETWLAAECAEGPVVFVLEDLQWADVPSLKVVDGALRNLADRAFYVLAVGRAEQRDAFRAVLPHIPHEVAVAPLTRKAASRLAHDVLGDRVPAAVVERVVERADGNPFHLEEWMRAVVAGDADQLPDTVLGMVQARLDALGFEAKRVLRVASVFGQTFWRGGVISLGGVELTQATDEWIHELVNREIVSRRNSTRVHGDVEYVFRNSILREAAYASLTDEDRTMAHALAGRWLESAGSVDAAALADHFERGGEHARAAHWLVAAAETALAGNDFAAAVQSSRRAIDCGVSGALRGEARCIEAEAHRWQGDLDECLACAEQAIAALETGTSRWYRSLGEASMAAMRTMKRDAIRACTERWIATQPAPDALDAAIATGARTAAGLTTIDLAAAKALMDVVRERAKLGSLDASARARLAQADSQITLYEGDLASALTAVEISIREFRQAGDERNATLQRANASNAYAESGRYADAERECRDALVAAQRMGLKSLDAFAKHNLGRILGCLGDHAGGLVVEQQALDYFASQGDPRMESFCAVCLSELQQRAGRIDDAIAEAERAIAIADARAPAIATTAYTQLAACHLAAGRAERALSFAEQAFNRLAESGPNESGDELLRLVYAESLAAMGRHNEARMAIVDAKQSLERRAARIRDTAARESFVINVPARARTFELAERWLAGAPSL